MTSESILRYLNNNIRFDGRKLDEFRPIQVKKGVTSTAEGSAQVKIGDTEVIAGVKMELGTPFPDKPDEGVMMVGAEFLPMASPDFEAGPPGIDSIELARVVDRGIRESDAIDTKKLCIRKGEKVWMINVDVCTLNNDGNLLDAAGIAAIAAIQDTKMPELDGDTVDYKKLSKKGLPISKEPIPVTVFKLGDKFIVDPTVEEEVEADARLTVGTNEQGKIVSMQKGKDCTLMADDVAKMVDLAVKHAKVIRKKL